jgi:protein-tyrosine-phosphatase
MSERSEGPFRLLFVCTGNTCRSPMAEVIARRRLSELGWDQVEVASAGVAAYDGSPASGGAVRTAAANELDLSGHSATLLTEEEAGRADLILTMSMSHLMRVAELGAGERVALLTSFAGGTEGGDPSGGIPDPVGGPDSEYAETFDLLDALVSRVLERIAPAVKP